MHSILQRRWKRRSGRHKSIVVNKTVTKVKHWQWQYSSTLESDPRGRHDLSEDNSPSSNHSEKEFGFLFLQGHRLIVDYWTCSEFACPAHSKFLHTKKDLFHAYCCFRYTIISNYSGLRVFIVGPLETYTGYNDLLSWFLFFRPKNDLFEGHHRVETVFSWPFKYQFWEELFLLQGCVIALGVDGSILRNIKLLSFTLVPIYIIRSTVI